MDYYKVEDGTIYRIADSGEAFDLNADGEPCETDAELIEFGQEIIGALADQLRHGWIIRDAAEDIKDIDELTTVLNGAGRVSEVESVATDERIQKENLLFDVF